MKKTLCFLILTVIISCNSKNKIEKDSSNFTQKDTISKEIKITGNKYFDYDKLEYYNLKLDEEDLSKLYDNQEKSEIDSLKMGIIMRNSPKSLADSSFIKVLKQIGYTKTTVPHDKFKKIDSIFTEKKHPEPVYTGCVYVYRDILVFKKKNKTIGIAKICFQCGANKIVGTKSNTEEFGQSGDYWKLQEILNNK